MPVIAYKITINPKSHSPTGTNPPPPHPRPGDNLNPLLHGHQDIYANRENYNTITLQEQLSRLLTSVYVVFSKLLPARALTKCRQ